MEDRDIDFEHRLTEVEQRAKSNTRRIDEHDQEIKENNNLIGAIKELATEVKYMRADLNDTIERLNKLEGKDSNKWEKFKWLLVAGLVTIVLGSLLSLVAVSVWNTLNDPTTKGLGDSERAKSYTDPQ